MTTERDPQRLVARVKHVDPEDNTAYLQIQNGNIIPHDLYEGEDFSENDIVLIGPQIDDLTPAPPELWPEAHWVGIVSALLEREAIVNINGNLTTLPHPEGLVLAEGNTVEGGDRSGIIRVLHEKPIRQLEITISDNAFDVASLREEPDGSLSYNDFGGYDEVKERTKELIELPLQRRQELLKIGARAIKGVLFTGPAGTGKTLLGRIIAQQAQAKFYKISGPEIVSKYVGQSEEIIRSIFDDAKQQDRAIIFFDEIDSVAPQRSDESHESSRRLVGQLLTSMDGFDEDTNVVVIATTNRPQDIDVALRRPGRFDWQIHFGYPSINDRIRILAASSSKLHVESDLPHELIAARTEGWSPAELAAIWSDAALLAVMDEREIILAQDYLAGHERVAKQKELVAATQRKEKRENGDA